MTWQSIDEDTYIDDTLVTCAEYQLFIDEMREQGKYYQPDHWTSYQFPKGQAWRPILGIRYSDGVEFCEWLSVREGVRWKYRLPSQHEGEIKQIPFLEEGPIGFWTDTRQFIWVHGLPNDPRRINSSSREFVWVKAREHIQVVDITGRNYHFNLYPDLNRAFDLALYRSRERPLDLSEYTSQTSEMIFEYFTKALNRDLNYHLDQNFDYLLDRALASDRRNNYDLYVDVVTLRERILGHSPAFEGIRLVKERIR